MATAAKKRKNVSAGGLLGQPILLLVEADAERRRQMARRLKKTSADILVNGEHGSLGDSAIDASSGTLLWTWRFRTVGLGAASCDGGGAACMAMCYRPTDPASWCSA